VSSNLTASAKSIGFMRISRALTENYHTSYHTA
jgi:hypothetical protein